MCARVRASNTQNGARGLQGQRARLGRDHRGLLLAGVVVAVVVVIDQGLWDYVTGYRGVVVEDECYLGPPSNSTNTCVLYWCLAAISGFCALFAFFAAACGRGRRSPGTLCALPFAAVLFLAAAITNSVVVPQANDQYAAAPAEASAAAGGGLAEQEILTLRAQLVH